MSSPYRAAPYLQGLARLIHLLIVCPKTALKDLHLGMAIVEVRDAVEADQVGAATPGEAAYDVPHPGIALQGTLACVGLN